MMYLQPGNGRLYIAFGDGWAKLNTALSIPLSSTTNKSSSITILAKSIGLTHFFKTTIKDPQTLLEQPLLFGYKMSDEQNETAGFFSSTRIKLEKVKSGFTFSPESDFTEDTIGQ